MSNSKGFFYPVPLEELLNPKNGSITQEKEIDFQQRVNNMERDALREEKLRAEKERGQKFVETDFDFKGEDEDIIMPRVKLPENVKFKNTKARVELDQVFSVVEYAKLPENMKDLFSVKKADKPAEDGSIEYLDFDKSTEPNLYKYTRKSKLRKTEPNILNLYDVSLKSLLTSSEILKRAEVMAKLYMKCHYDEDKYSKDLEERRLLQKKNDKGKKDLTNEPMKNDSLLSTTTVLVETQREQTQNPTNPNLPPGARVIQSVDFPPPPPIKLPTPTLSTQTASSTGMGFALPPMVNANSGGKPSILMSGLPPLPKKVI